MEIRGEVIMLEIAYDGKERRRKGRGYWVGSQRGREEERSIDRYIDR